jgi:hypothetical protein
MRVRSRFHVLKIRLRQRRRVRPQGGVMGGAAAGKENKGDEDRQQD